MVNILILSKKTGGADRTIKFWDMASGKLKLTLTGHVSTVRGITISDRHPYAFSCGEDKMVKCWDLQENKSIRKEFYKNKVVIMDTFQQFIQFVFIL
jgi:WD40 repeat protein